MVLMTSQIVVDWRIKHQTAHLFLKIILQSFCNRKMKIVKGLKKNVSLFEQEFREINKKYSAVVEPPPVVKW